MSLPPCTRGVVLVLLALCPLASAAAAERIGTTHESFADWKARLPRDPVDGAYIVEGDIGLYDDADLATYYASHDQPGALIVNKTDEGADDRWDDDQKMNLTYCVSQSFGEHYDEVVAAVASAASAWEQATAVHFVYQEDQDASCNAENDQVVFEVEPAVGTMYNAKSFFPSYVKKGHHELLVDLDNALHAPPKTLTGIMRHELGHVLGFRHEHVRPESNGACVEGRTWRALTPYDARSVMHYVARSRCKGLNEGDYALTPLDKEGAVSLYGPADQAQFAQWHAQK